MKIAIIVHTLTNGGAERVAAMWAQGFDKKGYEVVVIIHDENCPITYTLPEKVRLEIVVSHKRGQILRTVDRIFKLRSMLKTERPDVVIDVMPDYWKLAAMVGLKMKKVSTEHNTFERPENAEQKYDKKRKIYLNRLYDHVTVLTQADKKVIGTQLKHVTVLPNPLAFEPVSIIPEKEKVILAMGRLDAGHSKGFDILIKAFGMASLDGWSLQIAGSGKPESLAKYKKLAKDCGVEQQVQFVGFVNNPISLYQKASIFVLSSRYEGFGLVLIEAMSQGCACIACDYKGRQKEIITSDKQGITCETENVEGMAKSIQTLVRDDNLRRSMAANAIERSKEFCIDKIVERWEQVFKEMNIV